MVRLDYGDTASQGMNIHQIASVKAEWKDTHFQRRRNYSLPMGIAVQKFMLGTFELNSTIFIKVKHCFYMIFIILELSKLGHGALILPKMFDYLRNVACLKFSARTSSSFCKNSGEVD